MKELVKLLNNFFYSFVISLNSFQDISFQIWVDSADVRHFVFPGYARMTSGVGHVNFCLDDLLTISGLNMIIYYHFALLVCVKTVKQTFISIRLNREKFNNV